MAARPELVGGGVWGYEDVLRVLYPFLAHVRALAAQQPDLQVSSCSAWGALHLDEAQPPLESSDPARPLNVARRSPSVAGHQRVGGEEARRPGAEHASSAAKARTAARTACCVRAVPVLCPRCDPPQVHVVSADVAKAFDSLDISQLLGLVDGVLSQQNYHIIR